MVLGKQEFIVKQGEIVICKCCFKRFDIAVNVVGKENCLFQKMCEFGYSVCPQCYERQYHFDGEKEENVIYKKLLASMKAIS